MIIIIIIIIITTTTQLNGTMTGKMLLYLNAMTIFFVTFHEYY